MCYQWVSLHAGLPYCILVIINKIPCLSLYALLASEEKAKVHFPLGSARPNDTRFSRHVKIAASVCVMRWMRAYGRRFVRLSWLDFATATLPGKIYLSLCASANASLSNSLSLALLTAPSWSFSSFSRAGALLGFSVFLRWDRGGWPERTPSRRQHKDLRLRDAPINMLRPCRSQLALLRCVFRFSFDSAPFCSVLFRTPFCSQSSHICLLYMRMRVYRVSLTISTFFCFKFCGTNFGNFFWLKSSSISVKILQLSQRKSIYLKISRNQNFMLPNCILF